MRTVIHCSEANRSLDSCVEDRHLTNNQVRAFCASHGFHTGTAEIILCWYEGVKFTTLHKKVQL
jgi:hypothetical protein